MNTTEVAEFAGVTPRQVDYWRNKYGVRPSNRVKGSGMPAEWSHRHGMVFRALGAVSPLFGSVDALALVDAVRELPDDDLECGFEIEINRALSIVVTLEPVASPGG